MGGGQEKTQPTAPWIPDHYEVHKPIVLAVVKLASHGGPSLNIYFGCFHFLLLRGEKPYVLRFSKDLKSGNPDRSTSGCAQVLKRSKPL